MSAAFSVFNVRWLKGLESETEIRNDNWTVLFCIIFENVTVSAIINKSKDMKHTGKNMSPSAHTAGSKKCSVHPTVNKNSLNKFALTKIVLHF